MGNRVTHYGKITGHVFLFLIFILTKANASSLSINVYLKPASGSDVQKLSIKFHDYLKKTAGLKWKNYPLHLTLYLTDYPQSKIPSIIAKVRRLAHHYKSIIVNSRELEVSPSLYAMLSINNTLKLQQLSDALIKSLMPLRDKQAIIPNWARHDKKKQECFLRFGSPNVGTQFSPHFTFLAVEALSESKQGEIYKQLVMLTQTFRKKHPRSLQIKLSTIGVGIANSRGQIVRELASFELG